VEIDCLFKRGRRKKDKQRQSRRRHSSARHQGILSTDAQADCSAGTESQANSRVCVCEPQISTGVRNRTSTGQESVWHGDRVMPRLNGNIGDGAAHQSYPPAQDHGSHTAYSIEPKATKRGKSRVASQKKKKMYAGYQEPDLHAVRPEVKGRRSARGIAVKYELRNSSSIEESSTSGWSCAERR
jgi:hypothetical protein